VQCIHYAPADAGTPLRRPSGPASGHPVSRRHDPPSAHHGRHQPDPTAGLADRERELHGRSSVVIEASGGGGYLAPSTRRYVALPDSAAGRYDVPVGTETTPSGGQVRPSTRNIPSIT